MHCVGHTTIEYPLTDKAIAEILDAIQPAIEAAGGKCLVLIDTLRSAFVGEDYDERDESSMVRLLRPLQRLAKKYNACVVVLHHNAKYSNAYSGSTAIAAVADTLWNWKSDKIALTGELIMEGTRGDSQYPITFAYRMDDQRYYYFGSKAEQNQAEEDKRIYHVIKYLDGQSRTLKELEEPTGKNRTAITRAIDDAYEAHYVTRCGLGTKASAFQYALTDSGREIIQRYATQDQLGLLG